MPIKLLLAGYLGCGNFGDDALMVSLHQAVNDRVEVRALVGSPEEVQRLYRITGVPRRDSKAVDEAIAACDALVFPGGSVFQDVTSLGSVFYYSQLIKKAKAAKKKVVMLSQGVGPLTSFWGKRMARAAYDLCDVVAVRDPASAQTLRDLGVRTAVRVTADLSFILPFTPAGESSEQFTVGGMTAIGVAPRPVKGFDVAGVFGDFCRLLYQGGFMPVLVPMDRKEDMPLIDEIAKRQGGRIPDLRRAQTPMQVQDRVARMDAVVAMRLHAGILAAGVGVPPLMVSYDPKVAAFARVLELGSAVAMDGLTAGRLHENFVAFHKDLARNRAALERKRPEMATLAQENVNILLDVLGLGAAS